MRITTLASILGLLVSNLYPHQAAAECPPPEYNWTGSFGGAAGEQGLGIAMDDDGGVVVTGRFGVHDSPKGFAIDFDPTDGEDIHASQGGIDVFITKMYTDGSYGWTRTIGGGLGQKGYDVAIDPQGNVIVSGSFYSTVDFDPTEGEDMRTANGGGGAFVTKLTSDGSYLWTWVAGGGTPGTVDVGRAVAAGADGSIVVAGSFYGTVDFDVDGLGDVRTSNGSIDVFVTKLQADGTYAWTWTAGGDGVDLASGVAIDYRGDVLVTGRFGSAFTDFDSAGEGDVRTGDGLADVFITRLNADGGYGWTRTTGGEGADEGHDGVFVDDGVIVVGAFGGTQASPGYAMDFDPSGEVDWHTSNGWQDVFITKFHTDGSYAWTRTFGGSLNDGGFGMEMSPSGGVIVTGWFGDSVDFDPTEGVDMRTATSDAGYFDVFLTKLAADGSYAWTWTVGGARDDMGLAVAADAYGNVAATGYFVGEADFDPGDGEDVHDWGTSGSSVFVTQIFEDVERPRVVHATGQIGETRPFAGYVDPRSESIDGELHNYGMEEVVFVFGEPVQARGGGLLDANSFTVTSTGGDPPSIEFVDDSENPTIRVVFATPPPLGEWTTIRADVEDLCGNPITIEGDMGPGMNEPDRIDFLFLPGDVDQNGVVNPLDLFRFRQLVTGVVTPDRGTLADYVDINRNGIITPADLFRFRQLIEGVPPATQVWAGASANNAQP
jgi:Dockerin type I domain